MRLPRVITTYPISTFLIVVSPAIWLFGLLSICIGAFTDNPIVSQSADIVIMFAMKSMLPVGIFSALQSWRMSRASNVPSDSHDVVEFLLGASAFVMIILGAVFQLLIGTFPI